MDRAQASEVFDGPAVPPGGPASAAPPGRSEEAGWPTGTYAAFRAPDYRRFFLGQAVSLPGTWMQTIAQTWLIVELTDSGTYLGLLLAAQFLPVLLLAPYGGLLADRFPKRRLLMITQSTMGLAALALGLLCVTHLITVWTVLVAAVVLGLATAVDNPTRQSFVVEMVGPALVRNAVSLNSVLVNAARAIGPAVAGVLIAVVGVSWCFLINAASFAGVLVALASVKAGKTAQRSAARAPGQLREGFRYVATQQDLLWPFLMIFLVGTLAWEFPITLPLLARETFLADSRVYGWLTSSMGVGAVLGGLVVARRGAVGLVPIAASAAVFGVSIAGLAVSPNVTTALVALLFVGVGSTAFMSISNATMQLSSDAEHRGRVMSLWSISFAGSTPIGGPIVGAVAEHASPRWALGVGAVACGLAAAVPLVVARRRADRRTGRDVGSAAA